MENHRSRIMPQIIPLLRVEPIMPAGYPVLYHFCARKTAYTPKIAPNFWFAERFYATLSQ